ncbi:dTMP kinase [Archaeoglobus profundus]|uniref:Probable thymidylate kinase n=1 Tax=Archaeoglobus profundus (strain DSM 5631 / JCM 9629 / NBRC 100127 / Av18) TaxID=572546 RepID=D2RGJ1_ARCPA|nr:dTMP kinase [Archaeoglobus profundus]ADB57416.1 thymidylate kinase [Archaeoglobus profundus DSM 5631]
MLIAVEGIDGSGKTTIVRFLVEELKKRGYDVVAFKEPTDSEYGKKIRQILKERKISPEEELKLFIKDREFNVRNNILPALKSGKVVIMDRYYYSTIAYQGALGLDIGKIKTLNEQFPKPDLVIILDVSPETALKRIKAKRKPDRFEDLEYLRKVRNIFLSLKNNIVVIDAERDIEEVKRDVLKVVLEHLEKSFKRSGGM